MALDPEVFAPGFADRMQDLMDICRNSQRVSQATYEIIQLTSCESLVTIANLEIRYFRVCDSN